MKVDLLNILPKSVGNYVRKHEAISKNKLELWYWHRSGKGNPKHVRIKRFIELDNLFFEGLGLWQGEGRKASGLYFDNSEPKLINRFLEFVEEKFGISRKEFSAVPEQPIDKKKSKAKIISSWHEKVGILKDNFTKVAYKKGSKRPSLLVYYCANSVYLIIKHLHENLKPIILDNKKYAAAYLRGIIAAEGAVLLKPKNGVISHIAVSGKSKKDWGFYKKCLNILKINTGKYIQNREAFPIYSRKNFEKVKKYGLCSLHPEKRRKFYKGMSKYQRKVESREVMVTKILKELRKDPKTYDELKDNLNKGRSTIQCNYIPILRERGLATYIGKRGRAMEFDITNKGLEFLQSKGIID